jgi:transposase
MGNIDRIRTTLIGDTAPSSLELHGLGPDSAAGLLVTAGDNPERLGSERAWAHLCGVTPIPASSGKVTRYRLKRGGDRNANAALYHVVLTRMSSHDQTRQYVTRRKAEGLTTAEIMRCLKRYVARQGFKHLPAAA